MFLQIIVTFSITYGYDWQLVINKPTFAEVPHTVPHERTDTNSTATYPDQEENVAQNKKDIDQIDVNMQRPRKAIVMDLLIEWIKPNKREGKKQQVFDGRREEEMNAYIDMGHCRAT
jgi:hypothetical protein